MLEKKINQTKTTTKTTELNQEDQLGSSVVAHFSCCLIQFTTKPF